MASWRGCAMYAMHAWSTVCRQFRVEHSSVRMAHVKACDLSNVVQFTAASAIGACGIEEKASLAQCSAACCNAA